MKLLILFVAVALTCVLCAKDPTTVCFPDVIQTDFYSIIDEDFGQLAIDFKQNVMGSQYIRSGYRFVYNLTDSSGYIINIVDGSCTHISASADSIVTKCLPANAVLLSNGSRISVPPNSVDFESWEVDTGTGTTRVAFTNSVPAFPVLRDYRSGPSVDVAFYSNPQTTVTVPQIFTVPASCQPGTVVG